MHHGGQAVAVPRIPYLVYYNCGSKGFLSVLLPRSPSAEEGARNMGKQRDEQIHERLLQEWHFQREMLNYYAHALQRLTPNDPDVDGRRRELSAKLSIAVIALRQVSDQLDAHERYRARVWPA